MLSPMTVHLWIDDGLMAVFMPAELELEQFA